MGGMLQGYHSHMNKKHSHSKFNNELLLLIANQIKEVLFILDDKLNIVLINDSAEKLFDCSQNNLINLSFASFCSKKNINPILLDFIYNNTGTKEYLKHSINYGLNKLLWSVETQLIDNSTYYLVQTTNFSQNNDKDSIHNLKSLIENMPCNVYWMDKDCLMVGCNQNVLTMLNMTREEFIGKSYEELEQIGNWPKGLAEKLKNDDLKVLSTGKPIFGAEDPPIPHVDNTVSNFLTSRVPLYNQQGEIIGVAGISTEISNLKKAREQALAASLAKSEFIANMSHDIRTPLTGVIGMSKIIEEKTNSPEDKQYAQWVSESGKQLLSLFNDILDVISAEHVNENDLVNETFDLYRCIQDIAELELPSIKLKHLDLTIDIPENVPQYILSDHTKLHRVLLNLVGNSIKFTEKGVITIEVKLMEHIGDSVRLKFGVLDTGIGIPVELQPKVFDRFFRINPSYKGIYKGHGIGLHIAQSYVDLLGGEITLTSKVNHGTAIHFELLMKIGHPSDINIDGLNINKTHVIEEKTPVASLAPNQSLTTHAHSNAPYLLLVEDSPIALNMIQIAASSAGCRYESAEDALVALELLKTNKFDLIITDIGLPRMSGIELTSAIRKWEIETKYKYTPIIGLTAHTGEAEARKCRAVGMNKILFKPATSTLIASLVDEFVEKEKHLEQGFSHFKTLLTIDLPSEQELFELSKFPEFDLDKGLLILGNQQLLNEMLTLMLNHGLDDDKIKLEITYNKKQYNEVEAIAHKMKGAAAYCGLVKMQMACEYLELYPKKVHSNSLDKLYEQLIHVINASKQTIIEWLKSKNV